MQLLLDLQFLAAPDCRRARAPFADAVHSQHRGVLEWRSVKSAGRVAQVVLGEQKLVLPVELGRQLLQVLADDVLLKQFFADPHRDRHRERAKTTRRKRDIGLQQPLEFEKRFFVEHHVIDVVERDAALLQAIGDGVNGKAGVLLPARKALLLRRRHDAAVHEKRGSAVVIERRDAENAHARRLEQRVDERSDR